MKKRIFAITLTSLFVLSMSSTAFAAGFGRGAGAGMGRGAAAKAESGFEFGMGRGANPDNPGLGLGICGGGYAFMWDENGNFLHKEAFETRIDKAINDGLIASTDKADMLEMYDYCATYGGGATGGRGGIRGGGRGGCIWSSNTP